MNEDRDKQAPTEESQRFTDAASKLFQVPIEEVRELEKQEKEDDDKQ